MTHPPTTPARPTWSAPVAIPVSACAPLDGNRATPSDGALQELADSIQVAGLLHPIHVCALPDERFQIYAGVRRWKAHGLLGAEHIPAVVHAAPSDLLAEQIRTVENLHCAEPGALDIARSLRRIKNQHGLSHDEVAQHTGMSTTRVRRYLGLFSASDELLGAIEKSDLGVRLAVELVRYERAQGESATRRLLPRAIAGDLSVRDVEAARKHVGARRGSKPARERAVSPAAWGRVTKRVTMLASGAPDSAVASLKAHIRACQSLLKEVQAS